MIFYFLLDILCQKEIILNHSKIHVNHVIHLSFWQALSLAETVLIWGEEVCHTAECHCLLTFSLGITIFGFCSVTKGNLWKYLLWLGKFTDDSFTKLIIQLVAYRWSYKLLLLVHSTLWFNTTHNGQNSEGTNCMKWQFMLPQSVDLFMGNSDSKCKMSQSVLFIVAKVMSGKENLFILLPIK